MFEVYLLCMSKYIVVLHREFEFETLMSEEQLVNTRSL